MKLLLTVLLLIGGPMAVVQLLYRIIDHKGTKTVQLVKKFPVLHERKFLVQIGGAVGFVLIFGVICMLLNVPINVFFIVSGIVIGLINGFSVTLMYNEDVVAGIKKSK